MLKVIDAFSAWTGRAAAWLIAALTGLIVWEVGSRYAFSNPHPWAFDAQAMLYGSLFMLAGAYTLAAAGHVRGDVLYGFLPPRAQAAIDLALYIAFFLPGTVALIWAGYYFAEQSWAIDEHSNVTMDGPPIYPFKAVIPVAGALILVQGLAEIVRSAICLVTGRWPPRAGDVQEAGTEELQRALRG
jgi:TRAP-type mannitol/chloroaromatic compound transport system permease small subunit